MSTKLPVENLKVSFSSDFFLFSFILLMNNEKKTRLNNYVIALFPRQFNSS